MMYSGIDLHSNNSVVAIIDDADRVVAQKRLPNDISKITGFLARWQDELTGVVVESTYNWYWLVDGLQDAGLHVHLANTAAIKQYEGLKHSGDETDARHLAHLLRNPFGCGGVPTFFWGGHAARAQASLGLLLDPDGCLARSVMRTQPSTEETGVVRTRELEKTDERLWQLALPKKSGFALDYGPANGCHRNIRMAIAAASR
jgi:hypothetical protein